jgi:CheY-like chemotaxis protein
MASSDPLGRKTILVIEDDRAVSNLLRDALEAEGYRCVAASEGQSALELARDEQPSLITLDIDLPDTDGHRVLHGLRADQATSAIPIVVVSGYSGLLPGGDRAGLAALLPKPVDLGALASIVREALAQPAFG